MPPKTVLAIDLGNFSIRMAGADALAVPRIIPNKDREDFTPTCLLYDNGGFVLGRAARAEQALRPEDVITDFKPAMGTNKILFERDGKQYRARDLYGEVLKILKTWAEPVLAAPATDVIATCPEQWGTKERQDVEAAARIAGLSLKVILSEAVAAAVGYGIATAGEVTMVADVGSSTTDVSIVKISDDRGRLRYQVLATAGELVGGRDIDAAIEQHVLAFLQAQGITPPAGDRTFFAILRERIQGLKEALSDIEKKTILVECSDKRVQYTLTRGELERIAVPIIGRMIEPCERALAAAQLAPTDLNSIVPVGGPVKMPLIRSRLAQIGPPVRQDVDPDRATVYGAVRMGGAAGGLSIDGKLLPASEIAVEEVMSVDLSVIAVDGKTGGERAFVLVPAQSKLPAKGEDRFDLLDPNQQTKAVIVITDGKQGSPPAECRVLDRFEIDDLPVTPQQHGGRIAIRFAISKNGIADVTVVYNGLANSDSAIMNKLTPIMRALVCEKYSTHIRRQWWH